MRAGLLTETILLQESVPVKNEFGATSMEWVDYLQTRANIKFNSGNRVIRIMKYLLLIHLLSQSGTIIR